MWQSWRTWLCRARVQSCSDENKDCFERTAKKYLRAISDRKLGLCVTTVNMTSSRLHAGIIMVENTILSMNSESNTSVDLGTETYLSSSSCRRLLTVWALFSRVSLCRRKKVCWNMRSRYSSKSTGTQFFDTSSLTQVMASTPSRARSTLLPSLCCPFRPPPFDVGGIIPGLSCPLEEEELEEMKGPVLAFVRRSQPKRAKWKMEASRVGVMLVDRGIQLNRWAKHSKTRQQTCWLSLSSVAMGWQSSFEYWLPWNKLPSNSTARLKRHKIAWLTHDNKWAMLGNTNKQQLFQS